MSETWASSGGEWASSGVDLHLDRTGPRVRADLEAQLREAVRSGRLRYSLRPGSPDVAAFPRSRWLAAARRALITAPAKAFGDAPDARGRPELHEALAGYPGLRPAGATLPAGIGHRVRHPARARLHRRRRPADGRTHRHPALTVYASSGPGPVWKIGQPICVRHCDVSGVSRRPTR
jgi:hypothetical protein